MPVAPWNEVERLFKDALDRAPAERARFLHEAPGTAASVRAEVERLLTLHDTNDQFLEPPSNGNGLAALRTARAAVGDLQRVGSFRLVQPIASGGMGAVWLAERHDGQFNQTVAIKLLDRGLFSEERRRRFDQERRALARLEHPGITRLIDGGETEHGVPYLVMEFVDGRPIDAFCDEQGLSLSARLDLVARVCDAVHFAHQNLIIHRDIKPSNVLVTSDGRPKLLDFGIAKLLEESEQSVSSSTTMTVLRALTPQYASPEQVRGEPVTTAADVYSLGVLLYELLTGRRPYDLDTMTPQRRDYVICEFEPVPPSYSVESLSERRARSESVTLDPSVIASVRGTTPRRLKRRLSGDVDNIVMTALRKRPERRYATVLQLAEDIRQHLRGLPIATRRESRLYRAGKFVQRNRTGVVAGMLLILAIGVGISGTIMGLRRARLERDTAVRVTHFLQGVFTSANPYRDGKDANIFDLLEQANDRIDVELSGNPAVEAAVRFAIAETYAGLWSWKHARPQVERALELYRTIEGYGTPNAAKCLTLLGRAMTWLGDERASDTQREAISIYRGLYGNNHPDVATAKTALAFSMWSNKPKPWPVEEAEALYRDAIATYRRCPDSDPSLMGRALYSLSSMLVEAQRFDGDALELVEEAVRLYRQTDNQNDRYAAEAIAAYGILAGREGNLVLQAQLFSEYLELVAPSLSNEYRVLSRLWELAGIKKELALFEEATSLYARSLSLECSYRATHYGYNAQRWRQLHLEIENASKRSDYAFVAGAALAAMRIPREFADPSDMTQSSTRVTNSVGDARLISRIVDWAYVESMLGAFDETESMLDCAEKAVRLRFPTRYQLHARIKSVWGKCLMEQGDWENARLALVSGETVFYGALSLSHPWHRDSARWLAEYYDASGYPGKAKAYRDRLDQSNSQ